jgi:type IV pilus assembly protein PilY1
MFDAERPITAPLSLSVDLYDNVWAYFGTGRYIGMVDKTNIDQQYFFGVKDPDFNKGLKNVTLLKANLLNADAFKVYKGGKVIVDSTLSSRTDITDWYGLMKMMRNKEDQLAQPDIYEGWYRALEYTGDPSERVISRASVLGGIVFFPGYTPNDDICGYGGNTNFYAIYYETGTAYKKHILPGAVTIETVGTENLEVVKYKNSIGYGAPPPSAGFHVGREEGATAYLQMSTGEVIEINVNTALPIKSGIAGWREQNSPTR